MSTAAKIFFAGPSLKRQADSDPEISIPAETQTGRDFQDALARRDFDAADDIARAHIAQFASPETISEKGAPVGEITIRPALGSCLTPYLREGEFVLETADPPRPHCLASFRLIDEPEQFGRLKVFLGTAKVPPGLHIDEYGDRQPAEVSWFYQTNPLVIYGITGSDLDRARYCHRLQGPIEEPFPLSEEHRQGIAAAMGAF